MITYLYMGFLARKSVITIRKRTMAALVLASAIMLCGCGATPMIELTSEEEDIITMYSAKVVAKHNVRLAQGLMRYKGSDEDARDALSAVSGTDDDSAATDADGIGAGGSADSADGSAASGGTETLDDIFSVAGLDFSFDRAAFEADFVFNNYYHLTPSAGNDYLIMYFTVSNTTDAAVDVDLYSYDPVFTATVDGSDYVSETTILPNDLATYLTTIEANGSDTVILLFDVPGSGSKDVDAVSLKVKVGSTTYNVSL